MGVKEEVLSRIPISEIVGERIALKAAGKEYQACCPFHEEKTPSFTVSDDKGFYHCFGCGAHGNAIDFLIEHDGLDYREALRQLAARAGVAIGRLRNPHRQDPLDDPQLWARLVDACRHLLRKHPPRTPEYALLYRELGTEVIQRLGIGALPAGQPDERLWERICKGEKSRAAVRKLGDFAPGEKLILPAKSPTGKTLGLYSLAGRTVNWHGRGPAPQPIWSEAALTAAPADRRSRTLWLTDDLRTWATLAGAGRPAALLPWPACLRDPSPAVRGILRTWDRVGLLMGHGTAYLYDHPLLTAVLRNYRSGVEVVAGQINSGSSPLPDAARLRPLEEYLIDRTRQDAGAGLPGAESRMRRIAAHWWKMLPEGLYRDAVGARLRQVIRDPSPGTSPGPARIGDIHHPLAMSDRMRQVIRIAQQWPEAIPPVSRETPGAGLLEALRRRERIRGAPAGCLGALRKIQRLPSGVRDADSAARWIRRMLEPPDPDCSGGPTP